MSTVIWGTGPEPNSIEPCESVVILLFTSSRLSKGLAVVP